MFVRACHLSLSWHRWLQSMPFHPVSVRSILMPSKWLSLSFKFPRRNPVCFLFFPYVPHTPQPSHPPCFDHRSNIWWAVQSWSCPLCIILHKDEWGTECKKCCGTAEEREVTWLREYCNNDLSLHGSDCFYYSLTYLVPTWGCLILRHKMN